MNLACARRLSMSINQVSTRCHCLSSRGFSRSAWQPIRSRPSRGIHRTDRIDEETRARLGQRLGRIRPDEFNQVPLRSRDERHADKPVEEDYSSDRWVFDPVSEAYVLKKDRPNLRRSQQAGFVVALGISVVNGYIWYIWSLAEPDHVVDAGDGYAQVSWTTHARRTQHDYLMEHFTVSARNWREHRWHTVLTAGFSHQQLWHLAVNTIGVMSFFPIVATGFGVMATTAGYLACIAGGSLLTLHQRGIDVVGDLQDVATGKVTYGEPVQAATRSTFQEELLRLTGLEVPSWSLAERARRKAELAADIPGLGASAGVCGLFTLQTLLNPASRVALFFVPLPAWFAWGLLTGVDAYCTLNEEGRRKLAAMTGIQIGHEAHLGGTLTALSFGMLILGRRLLFRR